jgi:hypothetical protein
MGTVAMTYLVVLWLDDACHRFVTAARREWRCKGRHRYGLDFTQNRVTLLCGHCGKRTKGWDVSLGRQAGGHGDEAA